jgi:hypothetical protein
MLTAENMCMLLPVIEHLSTVLNAVKVAFLGAYPGLCHLQTFKNDPFPVSAACCALPMLTGAASAADVVIGFQEEV